MTTSHDFISRLILTLDLMEEHLFFVFSSKNTRFEKKLIGTKVVALEIFYQKRSTWNFHEKGVLLIKKKLASFSRVMALYEGGRGLDDEFRPNKGSNVDSACISA